MKKAIIFMSLMTVNLFFVSAQRKGLFEGFALTKQGEKIKGFFDFDKFSPSIIEYKTTLDAHFRTMKPDSIKEIYVNDEKIFITKVVKRNQDSVHVFMRALVAGRVNLYKTKSPYLTDNIQEIFVIDFDNKYTTVPTSNYEIYYKTLFGDCYKTSKKPHSFHQSDIIEVVQEANKCLNASYSLKYQPANLRFSLGFHLMKNKGEQKMPNSTGLQFDRNLVFNNLTGGIRAEFQIKNYPFLIIGVNYTQREGNFDVKIGEEYDLKEFKIIPTKVIFPLRFDFIEVPIMLGIQHDFTNRINVFLSAGNSVGLSLKKRTFTYERPSTTLPKIFYYNTHENSWIAETGLKYTIKKGHLFWASYRYMDGKTPYSVINYDIFGKMNVQKHSISFGYMVDIFNKKMESY